MNIGVYQSAASLSALERWQDAVTQNISSSQVTGYKRRTVQVSGVPMGEALVGEGGKLDRGQGRTPLFPEVRFAVAFAPGENQPTKRNLDFAVQGEGFFAVQLPDGEIGYSRAGQFAIRADRKLVDSHGLEVLGDGDRPIELPSQTGGIVVEEDGRIRQGKAQVGKLTLTKFENMHALIPSGGGLFLAGAGSNPEQVEDPVILQGYLESANISPLNEMVNLVSIARAYEANQKIIQNRDQMLQRTLDALT